MGCNSFSGNCLCVDDAGIYWFSYGCDCTNVGGDGGGGTGGGTCFAGLTRILLPGGATKRIDEIVVGETVVAWDAGDLSVQPVLEVHQHQGVTVECFVLSNGDYLLVTPDHRVYNTTAQRFEPIGTFDHDARLLGIDGQPLQIVARRSFPREVAVFNLTVANAHTYFANYVLVHNTKGCYDPVLQDCVGNCIRCYLNDTDYWCMEPAECNELGGDY